MMLCGIISPAWPATAPAVGETELVNTALLNTWLRRAHPRGAEAVVLLPAALTRAVHEDEAHRQADLRERGRGRAAVATRLLTAARRAVGLPWRHGS
jgi:hypothetical protein